MNAQLKLKEEVEWQTEIRETTQMIETTAHTWRKRLVSIWEGVWHTLFAAKLLKFNVSTGRYEEELNIKHHVAEALMRVRMY